MHVLFYLLGRFVHEEREIDSISITELGSHLFTIFLTEVKPLRDAVSVFACRCVGCCMVFSGDESSYMSHVTDNLIIVSVCMCLYFIQWPLH